jgi:PIN domain nuclease of toxin-antitoxin system
VFLDPSPTHAATPLLIALLHRDPFDAIPLEQAQAEGHLLLIRDTKLLPHTLAVSAEAAR